MFALLGFIGFGWAVRNEYRMLNADDPEERERALERERRRAKKAKTDGTIEDEILDAEHTSVAEAPDAVRARSALSRARTRPKRLRQRDQVGVLGVPVVLDAVRAG